MYRRSVTACQGNPGAILLHSDSLILRKSAASFASVTSLPLASAYATRSIFSRKRNSRKPWPKRLRRWVAAIRQIAESVYEKLFNAFGLWRERPH